MLGNFKEYRLKIFTWLETALSDLQNPKSKNHEKLSQLKEYLIENFKDLVAISAFHSKNLVLQYFDKN